MFKVLKLFGAALVLGVALVSQGQDRKSVSPLAKSVFGVDSSGEFDLDASGAGSHDGNSGAVFAAASSQRQPRSSFRGGSADSSHGRASGFHEAEPRFADGSGRSISPVSGLRRDVDKVIENQNTSIVILEGIEARLARLESASQAAKSRLRSSRGSSHDDLAISPKAEDKGKGAEKSGASAPKPAFGIGLRAMLSDARAYASEHKRAFGAAAVAGAVAGAAYNHERLPSVPFGAIRSWFSSKFSK